MSRVVRPAVQITGFARHLAPEQRRAIKQALQDLRTERGDIRALDENLAGYYRVRVGRFRIIFAYANDGAIEALFIGERKLVYELFEVEFLKKFGP